MEAFLFSLPINPNHAYYLFMKILILLLILPFNSLYARCLSDIFSVGVSGDSLLFESQKNGEKVKVASDYGLGFRAGKIIYCPDQKLEFNPYLRGRFFQFADNTNPNVNIEKTNFLFSLGLDTRLVKNRRFEWLSDVEMRQEYFLKDSNGLAVNDKYLNLKAALGLRATLFRDSRADYNIVFKYGGLVPVTERDSVKIGTVYELDLEYFKRMAKDYSIRADVFLSGLDQKISDTTTQRTELGTRLNYIFRY